MSDRRGAASVVHLGTIAAVASLGYADWRHPEDEWRRGRAGIADWFDAMMANRSVADTQPVY